MEYSFRLLFAGSRVTRCESCLLTFLRTGHTYPPGARHRDPVSLGFTQPDIKYEWNKLYVLGLHHRTTPDGITNYIERISGYDVEYVKWFKPNGKAIVALQTERISGIYKPWSKPVLKAVSCNVTVIPALSIFVTFAASMKTPR